MPFAVGWSVVDKLLDSDLDMAVLAEALTVLMWPSYAWAPQMETPSACLSA